MLRSTSAMRSTFTDFPTLNGGRGWENVVFSLKETKKSLFFLALCIICSNCARNSRPTLGTSEMKTKRDFYKVRNFQDWIFNFSFSADIYFQRDIFFALAKIFEEPSAAVDLCRSHVRDFTDRIVRGFTIAPTPALHKANGRIPRCLTDSSVDKIAFLEGTRRIPRIPYFLKKFK